MKRGHKAALVVVISGISFFTAHAFWGQIGVGLLIGVPLVLIPFVYLFKKI